MFVRTQSLNYIPRKELDLKTKGDKDNTPDLDKKRQKGNQLLQSQHFPKEVAFPAEKTKLLKKDNGVSIGKSQHLQMTNVSSKKLVQIISFEKQPI